MYKQTYKIQQQLPVAIHILNILEQTTPVVDATLYRIYCSEFNKACPTFGRDGLTISNTDTITLKQYISDNLLSRTRNIVKDIESFIDNDLINTALILPPVVIDSLDDTIIAANVLNNALDPIVRLKASILENNRLQDAILYATQREYGSNYMTTPLTSRGTDIVPNVDKELLKKFIQVIYDRLDDLHSLGSRNNTAAEDIHTGYASCLDYIRSLIYILCYDLSIQRILDDRNIQSIIDIKLNDIDASDKTTSLINLFYKYSHLPLACAICIYPSMCIDISQDKTRCSITTDSFMFFKLTTTYDIIKNEVLKGCINEKSPALT